MFRMMFVLCLTVIVAGCRIQINTPVTGSITTVSGNYSCEAGGECQIDVVDLLFDETFVPEPISGQIFSGWRKMHRGLCGGSLENCALYTAFFAEHQPLMDLLASSEVFYLEPTFIGAENVRLYEPGDIVEFSGSMTREESGSATVRSQVRLQMEFASSDQKFLDKNVMSVTKTLTDTETGESVQAQVDIWQESNGAIHELTNEYKNYYVDASQNAFGVVAVPAPLTPNHDMELQYYTVADEIDSQAYTTGTRSISMAQAELVAVPLGDFTATPVYAEDEYSFDISHVGYKRNASVKTEQMLWVSQAKGIVKKRSVERRYSHIGKLELKVTLELEAVAASF